MKKRVYVSYDSAFGLPRQNPDAGLALIHLLASEEAEVEAVLLPDNGERADRQTAALRWLCDYSGFSLPRIITAAEAVNEAGRFIEEAPLPEPRNGQAEPLPYLIDLGSPAALLGIIRKIAGFAPAFSEIIIRAGFDLPVQRAGEAPGGDRDLYRTLAAEISGCGGCATLFTDEPGYESMLGTEELFEIRSCSAPLYSLLREYLFHAASQGRRHYYCYHLPSAVYLTNPELFFTESSSVRKICSRISDYEGYRRQLGRSFTSWSARRPLNAV